MKRVAFAFGFLHREALLTRQVCRNRRSSSSPRAGGQFNVLEGSNPTYWFCGLRSPSISRDLAPKNKISTLFPQDRLARLEFLPLLGRRVHSVTCKSLADMPAGRRSGPRPASPVRDLAAGGAGLAARGRRRDPRAADPPAGRGSARLLDLSRLTYPA